MGRNKNKRLGLTQHRKNRRLMLIRLAKNQLRNEENRKQNELNSTFVGSENINKPSTSTSSLTIHEPSTSKIMVCAKDNLKNDFSGGRRIVDVQFLIDQILAFPHHELFSCSSGTSGKSVQIVKEMRQGFISTFILKCELCKVELKVSSDRNDGKINTNGGAVLGAISIGCGFSQLNEFVSAINIPGMSYRCYKTIEDSLQEVIEEESWKCMLEAGKIEAEMARRNGEVDKTNIPLITVIADEAWCKRSYRSAYNARSGAACIVGQRTGKLLFLGVRNKFCAMCHMEGKDGNRDHLCFKNWKGTSTAMESDIILEGFKQSISIHGVKYAYLVGDGDSSVMKKLQVEGPYVVEKIECSNHLLRNYCNNLKILSTKRFSSKGLLIAPHLRQALKNNIQRLRTAVVCAIKYRISQDVSFQEQIGNLKKDIEKSICYVFGEHGQCESYFCKGNKPSEFNEVSALKQCGFYNDILSLGNRLMYNSRSLLKNMTNNTAESYNSVVAKFVGGKRIDYSRKGGYSMRCQAASISYNRGAEFHACLHKAITDKSPGFHTKRFIGRKRNIECRRQLFPRCKKSKMDSAGEADEDYGDVEEILDNEELARRKNIFLRLLKKSKEEILEIAEKTIAQRESALWFEERKKRITASVFGKICKLRQTTDPNKTAKSLLKDFSSRSTAYGIEYEPIAVNEFSAYLQTAIEPCGFYIDEEESYLGATPDGLVGSQGLIEVKCPYSCRTLTPKEAILTKKITYAILENEQMHLKKNHDYFYQVQGQLHITKRDFCFFVVWTPKGLIFEKIQRDDQFFENNIRPKLRDFYFNHLLSHIIKLPQYCV